MYFDTDAWGYFDGEATSQHTTVCVVDNNGRFIARGLEKHEVRRCLLRYFSVRSLPKKQRFRLSRDIERLDYALTQGKTDLQVTIEYKLGVSVKVKSRGDWYV